MRFDCGPTDEEKCAKLQEWHPYFVLIPRRLGSRDCRWLETIERKGKLAQSRYGAFWVWQYRARD